MPWLMSRQHDRVFFTDRDLGRQFPDQLRSHGLIIERHDEHFGPTVEDRVWLREVAERGWVAITRDARIRYSPLALDALMSAGARLFVIVGKMKTSLEAADLFIESLPGVMKVCESEAPPFIAKIRRDGTYVWMRKSDWRPTS